MFSALQGSPGDGCAKKVIGEKEEDGGGELNLNDSESDGQRREQETGQREARQSQQSRQ